MHEEKMQGLETISTGLTHIWSDNGFYKQGRCRGLGGYIKAGILMAEVAYRGGGGISLKKNFGRELIKHDSQSKVHVFLTYNSTSIFKNVQPSYKQQRLRL